MAPSLPLCDVRVLDLTRLLPGPYATLVLADLGASVDKVEEPNGGDPIRQMPPHCGADGALFYALNRSKRSLVLDLKTPAGAGALRRLVRHYDVLVESFRPGVMDRLGVGWEALRRENPRLVYCAITGYGQTGPDRLKAGHDLNYIARAGVLGYSGHAGGVPAQPGAQIADVGGGSLFALVGILSALHERARTGEGRFLDVSMTDGALAFVHMQLAARLAMGPEGVPLSRGREALNGGYACYAVYRTADGRALSVGALEPKFASGLLAVLGRPDLLAGLYDTGQEGHATRAELERIFASQPLAHWLERFAGTDLCVEPVNEGDDVLQDPQLQARGLFVEAYDAQRGLSVQQLRTPLTGWPFAPRPPPALGQHSRDILAEAGFSAAEMEALGVPAAPGVT